MVGSSRTGVLVAPRSDRLLALARSTRVQTGAAFLLYLGCAIWWTWPLVKDFDTNVYGAFGDLTGGIAVMREIVEEGLNPFTAGTITDWSAPDGREVAWTQNIASFSSTFLLWLLTWLFGAIPAFNVFVLGAFAGSGLAMFLLARKLTGHAGVALIVGWAFAFYPFAAIKASGHPHFAHGWVMVLVLWRMLELYERPSARNGVWAGLAAVLALSWSPYFLLIGGIAFAVLVAAGLVVGLRDRERRGLHLRGLVTASTIAGVFALALLALASFTAEGTGTRSHNIEALNVYSARPYEYVVPAGLGTYWGDLTRPWLEERLHGSSFSESMLYVGLSMLLLALVGVIATLRRRVPRGALLVVPTVLAMGIVAALWSAPPKVSAFGELITFPSYLTFELSGAWRVYTRFVVVVMLAVCVLAAYGLHRFVRGRPLRAQALILVPAAVLIAADLATPRPGANPVEIAPVYQKLNELPPGLVAEYPIYANGRGNYAGELFQNFHDNPIINGYTEASFSEARALKVDNLEDPRTAGQLAMLGVRYVVLSFPELDGETQDPGTPGAGFRKLFEDKPFQALYEVTAEPEPLVSLDEGFSMPEPLPSDRDQWLAADEGEIEIRVPCKPCDGMLELRGSTSFAVQRDLTIRTQEGRPVAKFKVFTQRSSRVIRIPLRIPGTTKLVVTTFPGPGSVKDAVPASPDQRSLSVSLPDVRFIERSRAARAAR